MGLGIRQLADLAETPPNEMNAPPSALIACLLTRDPVQLQAYLRSELSQLGLDAFVLDWMPLMNAEVGSAWANGSIAVRDEHLSRKWCNA